MGLNSISLEVLPVNNILFLEATKINLPFPRGIWYFVPLASLTLLSLLFSGLTSLSVSNYVLGNMI